MATHKEELQREFNVGRIAIGDIIRGKTWKGVGPDTGYKTPDRLARRSLGKRGNILNDAVVTEIRKRIYEDNVAISDVSKEFGISYSNAKKIARYDSFKDVATQYINRVAIGHKKNLVDSVNKTKRTIH